MRREQLEKRGSMTSRALILMLAAGPLAACATTAPSGDDSVEVMTRECQARGGVLVPNGGHSTNERANHDCRISGGVSRVQ